jgi:hypothetical protein
MSPIPGIVASQITGHLSTNNYFSIQTQTVGSGGASSIIFNSIPSTYTHLQLRAMTRDNSASTGQSALWIQFNGDSGSNYSWHRLYGTGSGTPTSTGATSTTWMLAGIGAYNNNPTNEFGVSIVDVLDYASSSKYKTIRGLTGEDENGAGYVGLCSGLWMNTNAVTSLTIFPSASQSFIQYSSFALYGVK